ncbi:DNA/RNA non-specific endonuclease, partial [Streptococcus sp. 27098_8_86]|uniref:DNA/RNA non-specific endonuclease n=1 Tax=Streptococcus sp. 27098_8_86 TaxID=3003670 RepID=UPI00352C1F9A
DRSNGIGSWWGDVVEGTRNLPIPQDLKDTLLFAEGFIGAAGSMVSETAIGAVDLTQIIGIASIDGVNRLTGGQTPEWMKRDLQGTADNLSSLAELGVGTYTALTDPGAAMRGQDPNASYADKAAYRAQQTGKALWDKVTHMDAYDAGGLTFEIASLFVGPAAVGKMAKGTKLGAKAAEMISLAKNSTKARILANVEKWGSKVDNILAKSNNVIGKFGEKLLDTRIPVGIRKEAIAFAGGMGSMPTPTFSVESKTLRDVMHFSSKHADDVVRVSDDAGKVADKVGYILRDGSHFDGARKLKPNVRYQAGEHNYLYQTDELGRISEAYADNLQLKLHDGRLRHKGNTPDKLPDDHAGHIFGDLFGGSPELDNLLSQAKDVNLKTYRRLERDWSEAIKANKKVEVHVKIEYVGKSSRPKTFRVNYTIDGQTYTRRIKNINGVK